jgi:acetoin utilization deacetylase AcuC-like enzyme
VEGPDFGRAPSRIHSRDYLDFFKGAWALDRIRHDGDLLPYTWPARTLRQVKPTSLHGQLGYYSFDGGAPITAGTWQAAYSAAQVALTAQAEIQRRAQAFALCRPPGHHAAGDLMGGYCYLNNAAIAAQAFLDQATKGRDPRRRLPPRQRHPVDFLRAQRRAVHLDPRPPGSRVSVLPRLCR